jgi:hypothetical protein
MLHVNRTETTVVNLGVPNTAHSISWDQPQGVVAVQILDQTRGPALEKTGEIQEHLEIRFHSEAALEGAIKVLMAAREGFKPEVRVTEAVRRFKTGSGFQSPLVKRLEKKRRESASAVRKREREQKNRS